MTPESVEGRPSFQTEGNLTYWQNIPTLEMALRIAEGMANYFRVTPDQNTLVLDFDGPLAPSIAIQSIIGYSPKRLQLLQRFLIKYPETSALILTSRHFFYGWGLGIRWIEKTMEVLRIGANYPQIHLHSLAYDENDDLFFKIARHIYQKLPPRIIIGGAGKDFNTRILEVILGHRSIGNFFKHDILKKNPELVEDRLKIALSAIFAAREVMGGSLVTIVDDGAMLPAVEALAPYFKGIDIVYIHMTESLFGRIPTLIRGVIGALAYGLRNRRFRELRELPNP